MPVINNTLSNTMYEYLSWRGDLTFSQDPFNEVDNLILAQLAYVDYDDIVKEDRGEKVSISIPNMRSGAGGALSGCLPFCSSRSPGADGSAG